MFLSFAPLRRLGPALLVVVWLAAGLHAEDRHELSVYLGAVVFDRPTQDSLVLVEFPFSLNRYQYQFFSPDSTSPDLQARIFAQVTLFGPDGLPVDSASTYFGVRATNQADAHERGIKLINSLYLACAPGVYSARLSVIDAVSKKEGEIFYDRINVEPPARTGPAIGGICLAYDVRYVGDSLKTPENQLPKNGFSVRYNPLNVFSTEDTAMYLYAELYNLAWDPQSPTKFKVSYEATTRAGLPEREFGVREALKVGETAVIAEQFDIAFLAAGFYNLQIAATDLATGKADTERVAFTIMAPVDEETLAAATGSEFDPYDTLQLQDQINIVYNLLDPVERKSLSKLDEVGMAAFLQRYWEQHDSDPTTPEIENRRQVIDRYLYANLYFSSDENKDDGWKSDRGRILIKYGIYDDEDDIAHPLEGNPYMVWHYYHLEEGVVFVFEDREGYGIYTLVHSNMPGEIYNSEWAARLATDDTYRMD